MSGTGKMRVLLADDHQLVRAGLRSSFDAQPDMQVVAEAGDGEAACRLAAEAGPDVVVMDISMPVMGGAPATEQIHRDLPDVKVLALTFHESQGYLQQLLQAGASGYLLKRAAADDLIHAIRAVVQGGTYLDPNLAATLVTGLRERSSTPSTAASPHGSLSDREEEVLRLIARGFTNREIAARLDVSVKTIETHKARSMEKLGLQSRAGIVDHAIRAGWLSED